MTFIIPNQTNTLDKKKTFGFDYSTGIKENNQIINFADWADDITNPTSGKALNVNISENNFNDAIDLQTNSSKLLFSGSFDAGLDTLFDFNCVFDGNLLPEGRGANVISGAHSLTSELGTSSIKILVDNSTSTGSTYILESKHYLKINACGMAILAAQGLFQHQGETANTTEFAFKFNGQNSVFQNSWNIDTFGADPNKNPSTITLDFKKLQTVVFGFENKGQGDIMCGFFVKNKIFWAHRFEINNLLDNSTPTLKTLNLNLPFRDEIVKPNASTIIRGIGLFSNNGVVFESIMDTTNDPSIVLNQSLNSAVFFAIGNDSFSKRIPFSIGTKENFVTVSSPDTPLFSIRVKESHISDPNRTVFNVERLIAHASGENLNNVCNVRVIYNATLVNESFVDLPGSYSGLEYDLSATSATDGIELFSFPVYENQQYSFFNEDLHHLYKNYFSRASIGGVAITEQVLYQTLTIVATPMVGATMQVAANIIGGEIA